MQRGEAMKLRDLCGVAGVAGLVALIASGAPERPRAEDEVAPPRGRAHDAPHRDDDGWRPAAPSDALVPSWGTGDSTRGRFDP